MPHVAGLLLAAGAGRRLGRPKALLRLKNRPLAVSLAEVLANGGCDPVIVVIGASAEMVLAVLAPQTTPTAPGCLSAPGGFDGPGESGAAGGKSAMGNRSVAVLNPDWARGMASSLVVGLRAMPTHVEAVVVALVDQPGMTAEAVSRVAARAGADALVADALVAASYHGRRGHPVLFGRNHWAGIAASASGEIGARAYLKDHDVELVECADVASDDDIDTPEAAAAWGIE